MNARDPKLTLRLEPALRQLARNPILGLAWLARRHDLDEEDLRTWLGEFNSAKKILSETTIDSAKVSVGLITSGRAPTNRIAAGEAAAPAPVAPKPEPESTPEPIMRVADANAHTRIFVDRPWLQGKRIRPDVYRHWRPVIARIADKAKPAIACHELNLSAGAFQQFAAQWVGGIRGVPPARFKEFLDWGDAKFPNSDEPTAESPAAPIAQAEPPPQSPTAVDESFASEIDAVRALIKLEVPAKEARARVVAIMAGANPPTTTGDLVSLALRTPTPLAAPRPPKENMLSRKERSAAVVKLPGTLFKLELTLRLVPITESEVVT